MSCAHGTKSTECTLIVLRIDCDNIHLPEIDSVLSKSEGSVEIASRCKPLKIWCSTVAISDRRKKRRLKPVELRSGCRVVFSRSIMGNITRMKYDVGWLNERID